MEKLRFIHHVDALNGILPHRLRKNLRDSVTVWKFSPHKWRLNEFVEPLFNLDKQITISLQLWYRSDMTSVQGKPNVYWRK